MDIKKLFIITGAGGHLGGTIIRILKEGSDEVRGLILPAEDKKDTDLIHYIKGDVQDRTSLLPLFENVGQKEVYVIHAAGIVTISQEVSPDIYNVNVNGTKNIISLCLEFKVKRLVYVSSVHAIPVKDKTSVLTEVNRFSPDDVTGGYAKTKAEATQAVLDAAKKGLDAVVVQPSGILGPYDSSGNHLVQMVKDYMKGELPACVRGGYDFVDVRDAALGCLYAADRGRAGECYILSNRHYEIKDILNMVRMAAGGKRLPLLPVWFLKAILPFMNIYARYRNNRPLYTKYSLSALESNDRFSHDKATYELGFFPRDFAKTILETVAWIQH